MAGGGWIKLYRSIENNELWRIKPFSKGQAWIDLLLMANYKQVKRIVRGRPMTFEVGAVYRSQVELAERWGWDRRKVSRFLKLLEDEQMCAVKRAPYGTVVFIENYRKYQDECAADGAADGTSDSTSDGTQVKKDKERIKKDKNIASVREEVETMKKLNEAADLSQDQQEVIFAYENAYGNASPYAIANLCDWADEYGSERVIALIERAIVKRITYPISYIRKALDPNDQKRRLYREEYEDGVMY